jgi:dGTPase
LIAASVRHRLEDREDTLSPYAVKSRLSRGRDKPEEPSALRTEFQRDRDRVIHSNSFRRLKHKTQVFIAPAGDHYVTRLTHTLEVSQIARTVARALNLNEDLTEAISLGHDLGHTPFGHIGEDELDGLHPDGFRHAEQSRRIVEVLEKEGKGLNLTWEVRHGIVSHSKSSGDFLAEGPPDDLSMEGQICRVADAVAYLNHDLADAFRAGIIHPDDLPPDVFEVLGRRHSQRIDTMVSDIVESSWAATGQDGFDGARQPAITMSGEVGQAVTVLREFMFARVYGPEGEREEGKTARQVMRLLFAFYNSNRDRMPSVTSDDGRSVVDYIAGMTDLYALRMAESIEPGVAKNFRRALL